MSKVFSFLWVIIDSFLSILVFQKHSHKYYNMLQYIVSWLAFSNMSSQIWSIPFLTSYYISSHIMTQLLLITVLLGICRLLIQSLNDVTNNFLMWSFDVFLRKMWNFERLHLMFCYIFIKDIVIYYDF